MFYWKFMSINAFTLFVLRVITSATIFQHYHFFAIMKMPCAFVKKILTKLMNVVLMHRVYSSLIDY